MPAVIMMADLIRGGKPKTTQNDDVTAQAQQKYNSSIFRYSKSPNAIADGPFIAEEVKEMES
jgi:hypothetical protein